MAVIRCDTIQLDREYINEKSGILNALTYASAEYVYKVIENFNRYNHHSLKWFDQAKQKKLKRTIIHKNAHLDEYFAELLFRAVLPRNLKDIEVYEHVLMSAEDDSFARISWPNGVVFGIRSEEAGGAKALHFFDEHIEDGTRTSPSCSQLVADEFLGTKIPGSIKKILEEVNFADAYSGAHQYHIKNILFALNNVFFIVGKNEIDGTFVNKLLPENWRRAINDVCITSFIHAFENGLLKGYPRTWNDDFKTKLEILTKRSLDKFLQKTYLKDFKPDFFIKARGEILRHFRVWNKTDSSDRNYHNTVNGSYWKDKKTSKPMESQVLLLQSLCYALYNCWGENIADFVMYHIWQSVFHLQTAFQEVKQEIGDLPSFKKINGLNEVVPTCFGTICRYDIDRLHFSPEKKTSDDTRRSLDNITHFQIYWATVSNPYYSNVKQVISHVLNERNGGFGIVVIENKSINSKAISRGTSMPYSTWKSLSDNITALEPDRWFQLQPDGAYADFVLNRTDAHQDLLPSELIDMGFVINTIKELA
jgi:hypothetical protein